MSDYLRFLDESAPQQDVLTSERYLKKESDSKMATTTLGKRALRRQRKRNKKGKPNPLPTYCPAPTSLRGQRKIPQFPCPDQDLKNIKHAEEKPPSLCNDAVSPPTSKPIWINRHFVPQGAKLYAALDLGTNNCRLLIATPTRRGCFRALDRFSRIVRLGEGIAEDKIPEPFALSEEAMERAMEALDICRLKLSQWHIHHQRLIATEACRLAVNGGQFLERVRCQLGLDLEIISRHTEAQLAVAGCSTLIEHDTKALVLFDIGGGSSEIALIDISKRRSQRLSEHIIAWTSLPVGVVTLAERFGGRHVSADDFSCMKNYVVSLIDQFDDRDKLGDLIHSPSFHLLGTSGTMTTLAGVHLGLPRYDRRLIDGVWMCGEDVTRMTQRLLSWDIDERIANPCIGAERADLVLAGCAILDAIRSRWPSQRLRVADRGVRDGILMELMLRQCAWPVA